MSRLSASDLSNFDEYIDRLSKCKLLTEPEVKILCDKAKYRSPNPERSSRRNRTWPQCERP